jgi:hypothetical protein
VEGMFFERHSKCSKVAPAAGLLKDHKKDLLQAAMLLPVRKRQNNVKRHACKNEKPKNKHEHR